MQQTVWNPDPVWKFAHLEHPLILASGSPRRAAILKAVGCPFEVVPPMEDDGTYEVWDGGELLRRRAVQKAENVRSHYPRRVVLGADTIVKLQDRIFGKPKDRGDAVSTLKMLSGRTHEVRTAIHLIPAHDRAGATAVEVTAVTFKTLSQDEISAYVASGEPLDKAGSYGIQGIGGLWVKRISGCYFNVMGLPLSLFWDLLRSAGGSH